MRMRIETSLEKKVGKDFLQLGSLSQFKRSEKG